MNNLTGGSTTETLTPDQIKSFINFELKVSKELQKITQMDDLVQFLQTLFETDHVEIWFYDSINRNIRLMNEVPNVNPTYVVNLFNIICERTLEFPYLMYSFEDKNKIYYIKDLHPEEHLLNIKESLEDSLIFPVLNDNVLDGFVVVHQPKIAIDVTNILNLSLLLSLVGNMSTLYRYLFVKRHVDVSVPLLNATVEIAKIIENQHELKYVIPIIGEIIDKNIESSLVYLFLKDEKGQLQLSWPSAYDAKFIDPLLVKAKEAQTTIISDKKRVVVYPLVEKGELYGAIVSDAKIGKISDIDMDFLQRLADQAGITISRCIYLSEVEKHAVIDALTGLDNRRQLDRRYLQEASLAIRIKRTLSLLLMDIDHFKQINDTYGHSAGDYVLRRIAKILQQQVRESDTLGRYGGEEFCAVLPNTNIEGALVIAERIRKAVESMSFDLSTFSRKGSKNTKITISIGISEFAGEGMNPADILDEADIALYRAKDKGRNRVEVFQSTH